MFSQQTIVTICFAIVALGNQQLQTAPWNKWPFYTYRDLTGALIAIVVLSCFKFRDFKDHPVPYIFWTCISAILTPIWVIYNTRAVLRFAIDAFVIALGVFLLGLCYIRLYYSFKERTIPKHFKPLFVLWIVMMVWMIIFRADYMWPIPYLGMFLALYLTPKTVSQREMIYGGLLNGLILAFILNQGFSMLFRPYDILRYLGNYSNPNHNCAFLCVTLGGILGRFLLAVRDKEKLIVKIILAGFAGANYSFILMTVCRTGMYSAFVFTLIFAVALCNITGKRVFIRTGLILMLIIIVCYPISYVAIRYLPLTNPYVKYYWYDGPQFHPVSAEDKFTSDRYIEFDQITKYAFGRVWELVLDAESATNQYDSNAGETVIQTKAKNKNEAMENGEQEVLGGDDETSFSIRYIIYKWFFTHLKWRGVSIDEQGFNLYEDTFIRDTHDIFLDYGINFGWPAMVMYIVLMFWAIIRSIRRAWKDKSVIAWATAIFLVMPVTFGAFEYFWGAGTIYTILCYFCFDEVMRLP